MVVKMVVMRVVRDALVEEAGVGQMVVVVVTVIKEVAMEEVVVVETMVVVVDVTRVEEGMDGVGDRLGSTTTLEVDVVAFARPQHSFVSCRHQRG